MCLSSPVKQASPIALYGNLQSVLSIPPILSHVAVQQCSQSCATYREFDSAYRLLTDTTLLQAQATLVKVFMTWQVSCALLVHVLLHGATIWEPDGELRQH